MILKERLSLIDGKTKVVIKNAAYSFVIKGINVAVNFLSIPLVLSFLSTTQYGIWLTLTSILGWFSLFDLGFGNGLRNHLTVSISNQDYHEGKIFISTTYAALSVIFGSLIIVFFVVNPFIPWERVFNAPKSMAKDIDFAVLYAMIFLFVQFIVKIINTVLLSFQRSAMADFSNTLVQIFILIGIFVCKLCNYNSLTAVAIVYSVTPVIVLLSLSFYIYFISYPQIVPSIKFVKLSHAKKLLNLGLSFFIIQIAVLILYASDNFIITQLFAPSYVTVYNIAFKYLSITNIFLTVLLTPFWSMTTKAYLQKDFDWLKKTVNKLLLIWIGLALAGIIQIVFSKYLYRVFTHGKVTVPIQLTLVLYLYFICTNFGAIFSNFLNGIGKIKLQLYVAVTSMIVNIPLAIFFVKIFHTGIIGIPLATIVTVIIANSFTSMQYKKIVNGSANGIWNK